MWKQALRCICVADKINDQHVFMLTDSQICGSNAGDICWTLIIVFLIMDREALVSNIITCYNHFLLATS